MASRFPVLFAGVLLAMLGVAAANFSCLPSNNQVACSALGDLYSSTNGSGWLHAGNWSAAAAGVYMYVARASLTNPGVATDYCSFYGVSCGLVEYLCVALLEPCWALKPWAAGTCTTTS